MVISDLVQMLLLKPVLILLIGWWQLRASEQFSASYRQACLLMVLLALPLALVASVGWHGWSPQLTVDTAWLSLPVAALLHSVWGQALIVIYLLGVTGHLAYWGLGWWYMWRRQETLLIDENLQARADELCQHYDLPLVRIRLCLRTQVPYIWGVWHPVMVLPAAIDTWQHRLVDLVLLHELGHVARKDGWKLLLAHWVRAIFWCVPGIGQLIKTLDGLMESACDDWVIDRCASRSHYARLLMNVSEAADARKDQEDLPALFATGKYSQHYQRLNALLDTSADHEVTSRRELWRASLLTLMWLIPVTSLHATVTLPASEFATVRFYPLPITSADTSSQDTHDITDLMGGLAVSAEPGDLPGKALLLEPLAPPLSMDDDHEVLLGRDLAGQSPAYDSHQGIGGVTMALDMVKPRVYVQGYIPRRTVIPAYPERAIKRGIEGRVLVQFSINEVGAVVEPTVVYAQPQGIFENSAIKALKQFLYEPQRLNGRAIKTTHVTEEFVFQLQDKPEPRRRTQPFHGQTRIALYD